MVLRYCIEDEWHAEPHSEHPTLDDAITELERLARVPWNVEPNTAPCQSWRTCGRQYWIIEYDVSTKPWTSLRRLRALEVSSAGAVWDAGLSRG
jgi:hypothetical protein